MTGINRWAQIRGYAGRLWIAYALVVDVTLQRVLISIVALLVMDPAITLIGYLAGMRPTRR